ncbi:MAG TPA: transposase [Blastocatellia bacterium]|nr:transposase [Blastocatellia bacterium]
MESLPVELISFISQLRPLMRAEVFDSFCFLLTGLLVGEAKHGTVRASGFAPPTYQPQRLSDLFCRHKLSHQAFMAALARMVLATLYPTALPARWFWLADATHTEKPYAKRVASVGWFQRTKQIAGRAKKLKGHCYLFAAPLYQWGKQQAWASVMVGALLDVKGRSLPLLVADLAHHLRLPAGVRHVWVVDRGLLTRTLLRSLAAQGQFALGRVKRNQVVYFTPRRQVRGRGRRKTYGAKCRVDKLAARFPERLQRQRMKLHVGGREREVRVSSAEVLLRGVWAGCPLAVRVILVSVPHSKLQPWYLLTTDLELSVEEAVRTYGGRQQIEVNFDEVKELGLGHYRGRSGQGVRRWPLFLCVAQTVLKFMATKVIEVPLPKLHWSWYAQEETVRQLRRRLIEHCRPRISRALGRITNMREMKKAA